MSRVFLTFGVIVLVAGLLGIPEIADLLSVFLNLLFHDSHTYYRIVSTGPISVSALLIVTGLLLYGAGIVLHRRRKRG